MKQIIKVLLIIFVLVLISGCATTNDVEDALSNFCERKGHNKVTDTNPEIQYSIYTFDVECDNEHKYFLISCNTETICLEHNKWFDCINESRIFICS